ncbi:hypothetical protein HCJ46_10660 [Listeria booriae]|nr:hypothetical protein [Listeria booriae]MBC2105751.1 hypothetical protein [Listeria booriae]MBC2207502.1 hypothetical protein [Listeria booriae]
MESVSLIPRKLTPMSISHPGIFPAGDVRVKLLRQVVTATGDGGLAG